MRLFVRGGFADVTPAGLTILAEEAVNMEALRRDILVLDKDSGRHTALEEQHSYHESLRTALIN